MKLINSIQVKLIFSLLVLVMISSCAGNKKITKKPKWIKEEVKVINSYLVAIGRSGDFGSKSWQMAEMDAHRKMAKVMDIYIDATRQIVKRFISNDETKAGAIRIITKTHLISKATLSDLEIVKDKNKKELRWHDENTNQYYIKIRLNLNQADKKINKKIIEELPKETQEEAIKAVKERSKDAHKRLNDKLKNMKWE